jgi:hypothetical protein
MSIPEQFEREQRSSIKVTRNAKGDPQWEIKVVVGEDDAALNKMREQAVSQHQALGRELA